METFQSGLFEYHISNSAGFNALGYNYFNSYGTNHLKTGPYKIQTFLSRFQMCFFFLQNSSHLSGFQMVGLLYFRSHLKSRPYANQTLFNHLKSRLFRISCTHCTVIDNYSNDCLKLTIILKKTFCCSFISNIN